MATAGTDHGDDSRLHTPPASPADGGADDAPILLSPPEVGAAEEEALLRALRSGWVAPAGPELEAFEGELAALSDRRHAVGVSSGTAALHLVLLALGVGAGDEVMVSDLTFVASVNAITYTGASPVLIDAEPRHWNLDPDLVEAELQRRYEAGLAPPAALIAVDLYGRCVDHERLGPLCERWGVPLIVDAAESLGSFRSGRPSGSYGVAAVLSFNGNKIITTSGGGAVVTDDEEMAARVRFLSTQAREDAPHYEHVELGFNYRLSNILAALGRAQLSELKDKIARRLEIAAAYRSALGAIPGVSFPDDDEGWNGWLSCLLLEPEVAAAAGGRLADRETVRLGLAERGIEARPAWKPMHRQPLYGSAPAVLGGVGDRVFDHGLCLPSGSGLTDGQLERVIAAVTELLAE